MVRFDWGWNKVWIESVANQIILGVVPELAVVVAHFIAFRCEEMALIEFELSKFK